MAQLTIRINGYPYTVGCEDGQEDRLLAMAEVVESRVASIKAMGTHTGESKLLVLAALLMADELHDLQAAAVGPRRAVPDRVGKPSRHLAETLTRLADAAEKLAGDPVQP